MICPLPRAYAISPPPPIQLLSPPVALRTIPDDPLDPGHLRHLRHEVPDAADGEPLPRTALRVDVLREGAAADRAGNASVQVATVAYMSESHQHPQGVKSALPPVANPFRSPVVLPLQVVIP